MTDFENRLHEVVTDYCRKRGDYPKSISMSFEFRDELHKVPGSQPSMINSLGVPMYGWRSWPIKFVHRKNYVEALPRRKPNRRKMNNSDRLSMLYSMDYAPVIKMPSLSGMLTSA